jgi:hypothetical protein
MSLFFISPQITKNSLYQPDNMININSLANFGIKEEFRIADCGLRIADFFNPQNRNPQSFSFRNPQFVFYSAIRNPKSAIRIFFQSAIRIPQSAIPIIPSSSAA